MRKFLHYALPATLCLIFLQFSCKNDPKKANENILRVRVEAEATQFNPYMPSPGYSRFISAFLFQTLGFSDPKTYELKPMLIQQIPASYIVAEGPNKGLIAYDFEIMPEAKWNDGTPITAHDIVFTLKTIFNPYLPTAPWRGYFETVKDVVVDPSNPRKCTAYFNEFYILALESFLQVPIMPAHIYDASNQVKAFSLSSIMDGSLTKSADSTALKTFATAFQDPKFSTDIKMISGSGPYEVESVQPSEGLTLVRKANWWANGLDTKYEGLKALPEKIQYRVVKDEAAFEGLLRNQDVDLGVFLNATKFLELQKDEGLTKNYEMGTQPIFQYGYWLLNNSLPALKDKNVRQAFAHLVDYNEILQNVYQGMASQAIGPISPMKPYYHKELKPYTYSLDKANTLLDAAGWKDTDGDGIRDKVLNGKKTKLSFKLLSSNAAEVAKRTAELIRDNSRKAGVEFVIDAKDINAITKETRAGAYETAILAAATMPGADDLYQFFHSASLAPKGENRSMYASPAADALIEQIRSNPDPISRTAQYLQLQAQLFEDVPVVFLFVPKHRYVVSKRFEPCMTAQRPGYYEPFFQLK